MHLKEDFGGKACEEMLQYHISNCITCSKNLPNVSCHPQLHLEIPKVPFACIAIDTIGKLPTTSSGNRYALTCIDLLTSYVIAVPMPDKTTESSCRSIFIRYTIQSLSFLWFVFWTMALN